MRLRRKYPEEAVKEWTELALTLGTWGAPPSGHDDRLAVVEALDAWTSASGVTVRLEVYGESEEDRALARAVLERRERGNEHLQPLLRLEPRSDRLKRAAELGVGQFVFDLPVSRQLAGLRFKPQGVARVAGYAAEVVREAALTGLVPEIALADITRAEEREVLAVVESVLGELRPRGIQPRWRLVDSLGLGDPLKGAEGAASLARWVRLLVEQGDGGPGSVAVQAADTLGLALANLLAGCRAGASPATSLFGFGHCSGWAATEMAILHLFSPDYPDLTLLAGLKSRLDPGERRAGPHRPLIGSLAWQTPAVTTPDTLREKLDALFPFHPEKVVGNSPEPLLTSLSGHSGLLYLLHRHNPDRRFDSEDSKIIEISAGFERQFHQGRQSPISWAEIEPIVRKAGII